MNKKITVEKIDKHIIIKCNDNEILRFEIELNKINGQSLFKALNPGIGDSFTLSDINFSADSKTDVVLLNTHKLLENVITKMNDVITKYNCSGIECGVESEAKDNI